VSEKKKGDNRYWFPLPIFGINVEVIFDDEWQKIAKSDDDNVDSDIDLSNARALISFHAIESDGIIRVYFPMLAEAGTIAHECFHLVTQIMWQTGERIHPDADELPAHLMGYFVRECTDIRRKRIEERKVAKRKAKAKVKAKKKVVKKRVKK
jgi:hypothetical protein